MYHVPESSSHEQARLLEELAVQVRSSYPVEAAGLAGGLETRFGTLREVACAPEES
jgi:hypothetical protein